ncbi:MAG: hypothetical protein H0U74_16565 [Bradymonadaceae bacterium]|nr:hypothetical protein [Lujinxingiaceae bacterium]
MARLENASISEIDAALSELEQKMDRLRVNYERYFMGVDRLPPDFLRKEVVRLMHDLEQTFIRNTAQKFRLRTVVQKFSTYSTYWNRILRQIEEGTYKRDLRKASRNQERRARRADREEEDVYELDFDADMVEDLGELQREFEDMDKRGDFDKKPEPAVARAPEISNEERERLKRERLEEIRRQLEVLEDPATDRPTSSPRVSAPAPASAAPAPDERQSKLDEMRRRLEERAGPRAAPVASAFERGNEGTTQKVTNEVPGMPTGGADYDKLRKLRQMKEKLTRDGEAPRSVQRSEPASPTAPAASAPAAAPRATGINRVIQRRTEAPASAGGDDDNARQVYNKLVEAKQRCNEPTANLSYEGVKKSMEQQREHLRNTRGSNNVDFQVVIKDGKAYLKPDPKD